jgi:hypothetical protein
MSSSSDDTNPIIKKKNKQWYGVAFCHTKENTKLSTYFPEFKNKKIKWTYLDPSARSSDNQFEGSMYELTDLRKVMKVRKEGFDFLVMPYCPLGVNNKLQLYALLTPLIAASCLLKEGGLLITTSFISFAVEYLDPQLKEIAYTEDIDKKLHRKLVKKFIKEEKVASEVATSTEDGTPRSKEDIFEDKYSAAVSSRTDTLLQTKFLKKVFIPFCDKVCELTGFSSYALEGEEYASDSFMRFIK